MKAALFPYDPALCSSNGALGFYAAQDVRARIRPSGTRPPCRFPMRCHRW